jgi:hypothetical protein
MGYILVVMMGRDIAIVPCPFVSLKGGLTLK